MNRKFPWYALWGGCAVGAFLAGAFGWVILFGLATWYCWPTR